MARYRKRPVEVEAFQITRERWDSTDWPVWMHEAWRKDMYQTGAVFLGAGAMLDVLFVRTLEGALRIDWGNWIIRGVEGEIYSCNPSIFEATYDEIGDIAP